MHIQTHILSGWCIADFFELTPKERLFAMIAATAADADGLGLIVSVEAYAKYHHVLGHNLVFGVVLAAILASAVTARFRAFWLCLALFHLHLILDFWGSGREWGFLYWWPFSSRLTENPRAWELASWQNLCVTALLIAWSIAIILKRGRSPFELLWPRLDRRIVKAFLGRATPAK